VQCDRCQVITSALYTHGDVLQSKGYLDYPKFLCHRCAMKWMEIAKIHNFDSSQTSYEERWRKVFEQFLYEGWEEERVS